MARIKVSPLAKRLAKERGVDLSSLVGTGPGGRIVKVDIEAARLSSSHSDNPRLSTSPRLVAPTWDHDRIEPRYQDITPSKMRQVIAQRLQEAKQTIPHFYLRNEVTLDALLSLRQQWNALDEQVPKVSINDFIIKACALALRDLPQVNVSWIQGVVRQYQDVDISVAVAVDGGLVTPVIRNADQKPLRTISAEIQELASVARAGRLKPEQYSGGTFSISNLGMYGVTEFAAVINPPQSCILAVGKGEKKMVIGEDDKPMVATVMCCTLSVDHRAVDGVGGALFLSKLKQLIEQPLRLVIE